MSARSQFDDLWPRLFSALLMVLVGLVSIWQGGLAFQILLTICLGLMMWEVLRMHGAGPVLVVCGPIILSGLFLAARYLSLDILVMLVPILICGLFVAIRFGVMAGMGVIFVGFGVSCLGLIRTELGAGWTIWIIVCVVGADVGGYFAGKLLGGPKFWPAISPKKTWSGIVGGWTMAACLSALCLFLGFGSGVIVFYAVCIAIVSQAGDLFESLMKRRAGVKDSSALIPGHGGLLDRFDGLCGATISVGVLYVVSEAMVHGVAL